MYLSNRPTFIDQLQGVIKTVYSRQVEQII